ncbi:MAG: alginate export family protein [Verrucomicrobia bacterium]|nr:alginate export family protein [Verrucomicrobiota bacterium]
MKSKLTHHLTAGALVLAATNAVYAVDGDYSPTTALRPSAGYLNDYLRQNDPYMAAWDFGVQARVRYEIKDNFAIAGTAGSVDFRDHGANVDNSFLLLRVKPHVGYTGKWFGFYVEGRHSSSDNDDRNPNPESDGPMDLHQAYVTLGNHKEFPLSLKVGRQELSYGDERVIGNFDWNNNGRTFDAAKLRWQNPWFAADLFVSHPVVPDDNNFNTPNDQDWFSGIYATTKKIPKQSTDIYFLARNTGVGAAVLKAPSPTPAPYNPSARDIYTLGFRGKSNPGELGNWDYTYELMGQYGNFKDTRTGAPASRLEHRAYAGIFNVGYTWTQSAMTPRVGLEYCYASGDHNGADGKHGTFENLFPTNHKFYGFMDFVSLQNIHDVRLQTSFKPIARLTLALEGHAFWLASTHDNFYSVAGAPRGGAAITSNVGTGTGYGINPNYGSYVGSELDLIATYALSPQITVQAGYGHFFRGQYIKQSLSGAAFGSVDANWFYLQTNFSF